MAEDQEIYKDVAQLLFERFQDEVSSVHFLMHICESGLVKSTFFHIVDGDNPIGLTWSVSPELMQVFSRMKELQKIYIDNGWGEWNVVHCFFDLIKPDIEFDFELNKELADMNMAFFEYYEKRFRKEVC